MRFYLHKNQWNHWAEKHCVLIKQLQTVQRTQMRNDNKVDDYLESVADTLQGLAWQGAMYQDIKEVVEAAYLAGYTFSQDADEEA